VSDAAPERDATSALGEADTMDSGVGRASTQLDFLRQVAAAAAAPRKPFEPAQPGERFGPYEIVRRIGRGGMGAVYEALHVTLRKRVAVKVLLGDAEDDREVRARFLREGEAAARIRHPHVVDVTDVGVHDDNPFLVMEYLDGESLEERLQREGAFDPAALMPVVLPVLSAVAAAHDASVLHRDLKPANIFLARAAGGAATPKVLDFGISKLVDGQHRTGLTGTASMLGTPAYMSPEQLSDSRTVDARSDQYSLGVVLYECLTGRRPFTGESVFNLVLAVVSTTPPRPSELNPALPQGLEDVVLRAMHRDPTRRFTSVRALASALLPFADDATRARWEPDSRDALSLPPPSQDDAKPAERLLRPPEVTGVRRVRRWRGAVALGVAGVALAGVAVSRPSATVTARAPGVATSLPLAQTDAGGAPRVALPSPTTEPVIAADVPASSPDVREAVAPSAGARSPVRVPLRHRRTVADAGAAPPVSPPSPPVGTNGAPNPE
jgi:serine/threonine-protein kinase